MDDDWDLQAVVRGCTNPNANGIGTGTSTSTSSASWFDTSDPFAFPPLPLLQEDAAHLCSSFFPDLLATPPAAVELEELCKLFYSKTHRHPDHFPLPPLGPDHHHQRQKQQQQQQQRHQQFRAPPASSGAHSQMSRSKRRKNQQKRVVCQVPAEGLSSDMWAWRKYGQKPIKGSPYPRGYYRCSSSKGCLARKQVERSRADPAMFIITYASEHNHPLPTHRNSLAGSTRHKYPENAAATSLVASSTAPTSEHPKVCSPVGLSPSTPLTAVMDEHELLQKQEEEEEEEELLELEEGEMFMDLEELAEGRTGTALASASSPATAFEECFTEVVVDHFPVAFSFAPWLANNAATAAGGN